MASPYVYTIRRRVLMQVVMIALLGAMLGLAALVRHQRISVPLVPLGPPVPIGSYQIALPEGWKVESEWSQTSKWNKPVLPTPVLTAIDTDGGHTLSVVQHYLDYKTTPTNYLMNMDRTRGITPRPITIAGQPGVIVEGFLEVEGEGWTSSYFHQYAVTVHQENLVLKFHMVSPGGTDTRVERQLFRSVLQSATRAPAE